MKKKLKNFLTEKIFDLDWQTRIETRAPVAFPCDSNRKSPLTLVAKRNACLHTENTHSYQYLFLCNSLIFMPIGAGSIRAISGLSPLDSPSNCTFVRRNVGLTFLLAQSAFFGLYGVNKGHFGGLDSVF